jgi:hypothetical protein
MDISHDARKDGEEYRTYWSLCHRIRAALKSQKWLLAGQTESDEKYVIGKVTGIATGLRRAANSVRPSTTKATVRLA